MRRSPANDTVFAAMKRTKQGYGLDRAKLVKSIRAPVRLPALKGGGHGHVHSMHDSLGKRKRSCCRHQEVTVVKRMCGLCGSMHAPGAPHITKNAANFNRRSNQMAVSKFSNGPNTSFLAPIEKPSMFRQPKA